MQIDKRILVLLIIIAVLAIVLAGILYTNHDNVKIKTNNTTTTNNTTVINATLNEETSNSNSENGQYGYCAICGKALSYEEAHNEYTEAKVCHDCASNPYYQSGEGADYANKKLYEKYPEEYSWMYEDTDDNYEYTSDSYEDTYDSYEDTYDSYEYDDTYDYYEYGEEY